MYIIVQEEGGGGGEGGGDGEAILMNVRTKKANNTLMMVGFP